MDHPSSLAAEQKCERLQVPLIMQHVRPKVKGVLV
jgi:hypothetical protein